MKVSLKKKVCWCNGISLALQCANITIIFTALLINYSALLYRQETTTNASPDYVAWADVEVTYQSAGARLCDDTERTTGLAAPGATTTASSCGRERSAAKGPPSLPG